MKAGVLALQGDFDAHIRALPAEVHAREVRTAKEIDAVDALIIPGGESTTLLNLLEGSGIEAAARKLLERGGAIFGTCAGAILLARGVTNPAQKSWNLLDIDVARNGFGRQIDSFETVLEPADIRSAANPGDYKACFIRAPRITRTGAEVEVLAKFKGEPVFVRQGRVFAATFHPELTTDRRVQQLVLSTVATH